MVELITRFLPRGAAVIIEIADIPTFGGEKPFWEGRCVGVQMPDGQHDPDWPCKIVFTEEEALIWAAILAKSTGLPIRNIPQNGPSRDARGIAARPGDDR